MITTTPQLLAQSYAALYPAEKLPLNEDTYRIFGNWLDRYKSCPACAVATTNWGGKVTKALFHALGIKQPRSKTEMLNALK
jgi:hypothetical protein